MKKHTLLTLSLLCFAPNVLNAQSATDTDAVEAPAQTAVAPVAAIAPRTPRAAIARSLPAAPTLAPSSGPGPAPQPAAAPQAPASPKPAPAPAAAPVIPPPPRVFGQLLNVRVEVTLSDSKGSIKTLTMTVADGEGAMNRTSTPAGEYTFNADAAPTVVGSKIRLKLSADANVAGDGEKGFKLSLRQSQTVVLNDGESVEVSRAADPTTDRAFVLSVKATIQR